MTVNIKVYGTVQGVFFRSSAKDEADKLGVKGWVRNNDGGSVEIEAVGEKEALEKLINWCKKGPPFAKVESIDLNWSHREQQWESFEIID